MSTKLLWRNIRGGGVDFEQIYGNICAGMEQSLANGGNDFISLSAIPSKPRPEGLGFTTENAWYLHLLVLQAEFLPNGAPYHNQQFDSIIASKTYSKALDAGCYDLTVFLLG